MDYLKNAVTFTAAVTGYADGDFAFFYADQTDGSVDYDTAIGLRHTLYEQTTLTQAYDVTQSGEWIVACVAYDEYGNASTETETTVFLDAVPDVPDRMKVSTYDGTTLTLTL